MLPAGAASFLLTLWSGSCSMFYRGLVFEIAQLAYAYRD